MRAPRALDPSSHVTLVLGAGGTVGRAFHVGVLRALADHYGWDARRADLIVGTSAGSQIGALLRCGWTATQLFERAPTLGIRPRSERRNTRSFWPASIRYLRLVTRQPWRARIGPLVAALLPEGTNSDEAFGGEFGAAQPWPERPLWIPAIHLDSGHRVVFGRVGAPEADVATAVRCSSSVPGLGSPVRVGGERYVDGGITSANHADLAGHATAGPRYRSALVLSPLACFGALRWLLRRELRPLLRQGIEVTLFEPSPELATVMGWNPMSPLRAAEVAELAYRTTLRRFHVGCERGW